MPVTAEEWTSFVQQAKALACWQFPNVPTTPPRDAFMLGVHRIYGRLWWPLLGVFNSPDFGYQFVAIRRGFNPVPHDQRELNSFLLDQVTLAVWSVMESHQVVSATKWAEEQKVLRQKRRAAILQDPEEQRSMRLLARHAVAIEWSDGHSAISNHLWANTSRDEESQIGLLCLYYLAKALWIIASGKYQHLDGPPFPIAGNLMIYFGNGWPEVFFRNADGQQYLDVYTENRYYGPGTVDSALAELRQHRPLWRPSGLLRAIQVISSVMALVEEHLISGDLFAVL